MSAEFRQQVRERRIRPVKPLTSCPFTLLHRMHRASSDLVFLGVLMCCPPQAGLIETNGELKVFIDQNLSPSKGTSYH